MEKSTFVYVTYIRTTPEKLWAALTQTEIPREFFFDDAEIGNESGRDLEAGRP